MSSSSRLIAQKPERFLCPLCRTDVGREYDLRRHQQECHTTPKECPERGCKYTTRREARLLEHMRVKKHGLYSPQYRLLLGRSGRNSLRYQVLTGDQIGMNKMRLTLFLRLQVAAIQTRVRSFL